MPVKLTIENAPDNLVQQLRTRAVRNHRSLEGELLAIFEQALQASAGSPVEEVQAAVRRLGLRTEGDSTELIRAARDGH